MHAVYTEAESNARKAFRKFDLKGRGFLDNNEATNAIRELGVCATFDEAQEMFESIDADGSGYVEEEEFVAFFKDNLVTIQNTIDPRQMATAMFLKFDADNSGELDVNEFIGAMRELGLGYTEEDAEQVFLSFDPDGSGGIDMDEFVEAYLEQWEMQKESQREAAAADFISGRDD
jgi:Ca2+-binding EF-hand superfamily protein